jgi:SAM-dependent methyltransferase
MLFLGIRVKVAAWIEWMRVARRYYRHTSFRQADLALLRLYWTDSPYRVSARYWKACGEADPYTYGETPLTTFEQIARRFLTPDDRFVDLGCGTGRTCLWAHHFVGCQVLGVECIPTFIWRAREALPGISIVEADLLESDLSQATAVYLAGTCLEDDYLTRVANHLEQLPRGAKVITVTFPITDYGADGKFVETDKVLLPFPWDRDLVYCCQRV